MVVLSMVTVKEPSLLKSQVHVGGGRIRRDMTSTTDPPRGPESDPNKHEDMQARVFNKSFYPAIRAIFLAFSKSRPKKSQDPDPNFKFFVGLNKLKCVFKLI